MDFHIHIHTGEDDSLVLARLDDVRAKLVTLSTKVSHLMSKLDDRIAALQADVQETNTVIDSAITLISGISDQIRVAVAEAMSKGATEDELSAMAALGESLEAKSKALADAVSANTPAA